MFHLTPVKNIESIQKNGLQPSHVYLPHMREEFERNWGINKAIFFTPEQSEYRLEKLFKDFVYWQELKKPISVKLIESDDYELYDRKMSIDTNKINRYSILNYSGELSMSFLHAQCVGTECKAYGDCLQEYGHDAKLVRISDTPISSQYLKHTGFIDFEINRFNKPTISIKWEI
jgi:hypothetical protein